MTLYPNPVTYGNPVYINFIDEIESEVRRVLVVNMQGSVIYSKQTSNDAITPGAALLQGYEIARGTYLVILESQNKSYYSKLIVL